MAKRPSGSQRISLTEDERLLTSAPAPPAERRAAFTSTDPWRVLRIMGEFVEGFDTLSDVRNAVTIFGSARTEENDPYFHKALETAKLLAREGFAIITGGGPGIMEAANRGALEAGGVSIGFNIRLPRAQIANRYITPGLCFNFRYFALRKLHFLLRARALVVFPGGFGTFDELFETLMLVQCRKIAPMPIVLVGRTYWRRAVNFDFLVAEGMIGARDRRLFRMAETASGIWRLVSPALPKPRR